MTWATPAIPPISWLTRLGRMCRRRMSSRWLGSRARHPHACALLSRFPIVGSTRRTDPAARHRADRSPAPPAADHAIAAEVGVSAATVSRVLKRLGLNRLSALEPTEPVRGCERERPGELIHIDIKKLGRFDRTAHQALHSQRLEEASPDRDGAPACRSTGSGFFGSRSSKIGACGASLATHWVGKEWIGRLVPLTVNQAVSECSFLVDMPVKAQPRPKGCRRRGEVREGKDLRSAFSATSESTKGYELLPDLIPQVLWTRPLKRRQRLGAMR